MLNAPVENIRKMYYSISEVCSRTGLEPHVLRYWESEFPQLRPKKNRAGNRAYREKDIEVIEYIKYLLYDQQFTIPGAKKKLSEMKENGEALGGPDTAETAKEPPVPVPSAEEPLAVQRDATIDRAGLVKELREVLKLLGKG